MNPQSPKDFFIMQYVAAYCAGMYCRRADEHLYTGKHPYTEVDDVPIEDARFMAEVAWRAFRKHSEETREDSYAYLDKKDTDA